MGRLNILAKGNLDLRDTLHSLKLGDQLVWNGVNQVLRASGLGVARVQHETCTRSDALLEAQGEIPEALQGHDLPLGPFPLSSQFSDKLFQAKADVIVLTVQPDIGNFLVRHRKDGFLLLPYYWQRWPEAEQRWLKQSFESAGYLTPDASIANFSGIIDRLRATSSAPILIYNVSSVVPGDQVHVHSGMEDLLSTRIKRFNLALIELSQQTGVSVIDVDALLARAGATGMAYDAFHLNAAGCQIVSEEVVRVLRDLGCVAEAEAAGDGA